MNLLIYISLALMAAAPAGAQPIPTMPVTGPAAFTGGATTSPVPFIPAFTPAKETSPQISVSSAAVITSSTEAAASQPYQPPSQPYQPPSQPSQPSQPAKYKDASIPLSGIVLMPTAYRGRDKNTIGLGLDINASYFIGRLYGKNSFSWTRTKTNYLDRVGLWLLTADAKMLIQTEGRWRPAVASGVQGIFKFRDAPQPALNQTVTLTVKATGKTTDTYANAYLVMTKRLHPKFLISAGYSDGDMPKVLYQMSEFLSKDALTLNGRAKQNVPPGMLFGGFMWLPKTDSTIGAEFIIPQGAPQSPKLINFHLGTLLKLNFEVSYLSFKGGWDLLGMFQFRYNYFPR
ncbi:MAG: hypothetical protein NTX59_08980 [Elusimicrobia bacterium]|nr:hypothetical protein [Elusimicrobiota bacterium]